MFYDRFEEVALWGKDLYEHLDYVYRDAAKFCVLFDSSSYAEKAWPTHERRSAQARAFSEHAEYLLPARFDDTPIPGLRPTTGYIDLRSREPGELALMIEQKLAALSIPGAPGLLGTLGISTLDHDTVSNLWRLERGNKPLGSALLGVDVDGDPTWLPLVQSGPILALGGTTGSGKAELLRSLLLSLALTHRPQDLGIAVIDFRGGAGYQEMRSLPHALQVWMSLTDEDLVSVRERLDDEIAIRQAALDAGTTLPVLVVVVDEFAELAHSDDGRSLLKWFWNLMRRGRPLNVCTIMASQRWSGIGLLPPVVRLRVALRTHSREESEELLGTDLALDLPRVPGVGWLVVGDPADPVQFQATYTGYDFSGTRSLLKHEMSFTAGETEFHALIRAIRETEAPMAASWTRAPTDPDELPG